MQEIFFLGHNMRSWALLVRLTRGVAGPIYLVNERSLVELTFHSFHLFMCYTDNI